MNLRRDFGRLPKWATRQAIALLKRGLETLAEALTIDLLWAVLRAAGFVGAGVAAAAVFSSSNVPPARADVPPKLALETAGQKQLVRFAHRYGPGSGIVYVWGGSQPFGGFDCSGFVYYLYRRIGVTIPRGSRAQWTSLSGRDVRKGHEKPGDVVYFDGSRVGSNSGPPPGHEGIYIGAGKFIDYYSSGKPARIALLSSMSDYMGAKRWWAPITVLKRPSRTIFWFASHFHVRIAGAAHRVVVFKGWHGGRIPKWRYRLILRWLHNHPHRRSGNPLRLTLTF